MDFVKKHYFWIFCGVLTAVALGAWVWTTLDMSARYAADKGKIESGFSLVNGVNGIPNHPNEKTHEEMDKRIAGLKRSVKSAWQDQYLEQEKVFVWPTQFPAPMRRELAKYRPIELKLPEFPTPPNKEVDQNYRVVYSNYMRDELPKLAETIGAKWQVDPDKISASGAGGMEGYGGAGGGYSPYSGASSMEGSGMPGAVEEERPVVDWNAANQAEIYNLRFNWSSRPNSVPTTLQMLYAQEDFWTLQSLMEMIRRTNGDADAYYEAIVKEIQFIRIGAVAVRSDAMITPLVPAAGMMGGSGDLSGMPSEELGGSGGDPYAQSGGYGSEGMPGGDMGPGSGTGASVELDPAAGRYVDNAYKPLTAEELRSSLTTTDPTKAYLAVAKRMPVRMRVRMDQRYLNRLLVECANAPLTLEVRQVRINPGTSGAATGAYGGGGGSPYGGGGGSPYGGGGGAGGFGAVSGGGMDSYSSSSSSYGPESGSGPGMGGPGTSFDAVVEIYGIVYIYNPPIEGPLEVDASGGTEVTPAAPAGETLTSLN
ncbi:MAG TPA: hypothetical protein VGN57_13795 [Pirellulaceae bacterium]|jgi:hypothetical protein|nr:hypothetical protein [Pirellulaceae bacterium]